MYCTEDIRESAAAYNIVQGFNGMVHPMLTVKFA